MVYMMVPRMFRKNVDSSFHYAFLNTTLRGLHNEIAFLYQGLKVVLRTENVTSQDVPCERKFICFRVLLVFVTRRNYFN